MSNAVQGAVVAGAAAVPVMLLSAKWAGGQYPSAGEGAILVAMALVIGATFMSAISKPEAKEATQ